MRRDWPALLIAAALLLGAAAQSLAEGSPGVVGGALLALGSASLGAWIRGLGGEGDHTPPRE